MVIPRELHEVLEPYLDRLDQDIPHAARWPTVRAPLPAALTEVENRIREAAGQPSAAWQQELEAVFGGQSKTAAPPLPPTFPTGSDSLEPELPPAPYTTGRIEAQPAQPPLKGSFRQR